MHVFRNPRENRLRAGWRLLLQTLLLVALVLALLVVLTPLLPTPMAVGWTAQALGAVGAVALAGRLLDRRPFAAFGFHLDAAWWADLAFGAALGVALMGGIFAVELAAGWVTVTETFVSAWADVPFALGFLGVTGFFVLVAFYEELLARGYHLLNVAEGLGRLGPRPAIVLALVLSSAVFGVAHAANPNATVVSTVGVGLAGILLGLGYVRTGELAIPIGLHLTWNLAQGPLFGFPVSGQLPPVRVVSIEQGGPDVWTGGAFGPEAGLIGLGAMLVGGVAIVVYTRRRGYRGLRTALARYSEA